MAINRRELVKRHNPVLKEMDIHSPLSVGNGEFAFTVDPTGLQTFGEDYLEGILLCTQSQWGWHTTPAPEGRDFSRRSLKLKEFDTYGRKVGYAVVRDGQEEQYNWLRQNPHRLNLCRIGLNLADGVRRRPAKEELSDIHQELELWKGIIFSRFRVKNSPVSVRTCCHPIYDTTAVNVESPLIAEGNIGISFDFPYGSPDNSASEWDGEGKHSVEIISEGINHMDLVHLMDNERYFTRIAFSHKARFKRQGANSFVLYAASGEVRLDFTCSFSPYPLRELHFPCKDVEIASEKHWENFWSEGGAVELADSLDKRALELERRIVLSQYLTAIQCAGSMPPQETGLTCNSWYGKFHLEMHYWHAAHFPLWGRGELLEKSLWWYKAIMGKALDAAKVQGYRGVRWPKMTCFDGIDSPSPIGPLLIWQQPHPILLAELCHRAKPCVEVLERYKDIVFQTAEFMASYAVRDSGRDRFVLGPPLIPAQENHKPENTINPVFELEYWHYGLRLANKWRVRLGLAENPEWEAVASKLAPLPVSDGVYLAHENCPDTFDSFNFDHPSILCALGMLPGDLVDRKTMGNTLDSVLEKWNYERLWGWDFPVLAMTAARLGRPETAVDTLLMETPKNTYLPNGHNPQRPRKDLPLYLPGNGGLLTAVATMAAGWDGCPDLHAPGFPADGKWKVSWEGLSPNI